MNINDFNFNSDGEYNRYAFSEWKWYQTHDTMKSHMETLIPNYCKCISLESIINMNTNSSVECNIDTLFKYDSELKHIFIESSYLDRNITWIDYEDVFIVYDSKCLLGVLVILIDGGTCEQHMQQLLVTKCSIICRGAFEHKIDINKFKFVQFNGVNTLRFGDRDMLEKVNKSDDLSKSSYKCKYIYQSLNPIRCGDHSEMCHEQGFCEGFPNFCCCSCDFHKEMRAVDPTPENSRWKSRSVESNLLNAEIAKNNPNNEYVSSHGIKYPSLIEFELHQKCPPALHDALGLGGRYCNGCCCFVNKHGDVQLQLKYENTLKESLDNLRICVETNKKILTFYNGQGKYLNEFSEIEINEKIKVLKQEIDKSTKELEKSRNEFYKIVNKNNQKSIIKRWYKLLSDYGINPFYCHENSITGGSVRQLINHRKEIVAFFKEYDERLSEMSSIILLQMKLKFLVFNGNFKHKVCEELISTVFRHTVSNYIIMLKFLKYTNGLGKNNSRVGIKLHLDFHCYEWLEYTRVGPGVYDECSLEHLNQYAAPWFNFYKHYKKQNKNELIMNRCNYESKYYPQRQLLM